MDELFTEINNMRRPKLKDGLYGVMYWNDWDDFENHWFARIENVPNEDFDLLVIAESQADFLAVGGTHATYKKLLANIDELRGQMIGNILEKMRELFKKTRQRKSAAETLKQKMRLYSITIYQDLSAELQFAERDDEDPEELFYATIDKTGILVEAGVEKI